MWKWCIIILLTFFWLLAIRLFLFFPVFLHNIFLLLYYFLGIPFQELNYWKVMNSFMIVDKGFPPKLHKFTKLAAKCEHVNIFTTAPALDIALFKFCQFIECKTIMPHCFILYFLPRNWQKFNFSRNFVFIILRHIWEKRKCQEAECVTWVAKDRMSTEKSCE